MPPSPGIRSGSAAQQGLQRRPGRSSATDPAIVATEAGA